MGLFDGQIEKLGKKLSSKLKERATYLEKEWATEKDPGRSLSLKIAFYVMQELSAVIEDSLKSEQCLSKTQGKISNE